MLASARQARAAGSTTGDYDAGLAGAFTAFRDDWAALRSQGLAYFRYSATPAGVEAGKRRALPSTLDDLVAEGLLRYDPIVYEDFLPVSAAGIFQSNLGSDAQQSYAARSNRAAFEVALGAEIHDEMTLYARTEKDSVERAMNQLSSPHIACKATA